MSEQIREQVSAFLDGELPGSETALLLKRLTRDTELRDSFGRYALIGEALRGGSVGLRQDFTLGVNRAIDGEPPVESSPEHGDSRLQRWWRPLAGAGVAAGVAAVAVLALQQRAVAPSVAALGARPSPVIAQRVDDARPREALSYTVPAAVGDAPAALPAARLTNYVFAHSRYSSGLGQSNVVSGLLTDADQETDGAAALPQPKDAHDGTP